MSQKLGRPSSIAVAADYAAVCTKTIRRRIATGDLPAYRLGRIIRVDLDDVDNLFVRVPTMRRPGDAA